MTNLFLNFHPWDDILDIQIVLRGTHMEELLREIVGKLGKLDTIESEIKEIRAEQAGMKSDINGLKTDIKEIKTEQKKMNKKISNIETLLEKGAFEDIKRLEKRIDVLEKNAV